MTTTYQINEAFRKVCEQEARKFGVVAAANKTYSLKEAEELLMDMLLRVKPIPRKEVKGVIEGAVKSFLDEDKLNEDLFG